MKVSYSHPSTSSCGTSKSTEYMDRVSTLSKLLKREVRPLMRRISGQYRGNGRRSSRQDSLKIKLVPTEEQPQAFADLAALKYLGGIVVPSARVDSTVWRDIWASKSKAERKKNNADHLRSLWHLYRHLGSESRHSLKEETNSSWGKPATGTDESGNTVTEGSIAEYAIGFSLGLIERTARSVIERARTALTQTSEETSTA